MTLCVLIYAWQLRGPVCKNIAIWFLCRICIHSVSVSVGWRASWEALQWFHECIIKLDNSSFSFCHVWSDFLSRERETLFFFLSLKHFLQRICVAFGLLFFFCFSFLVDNCSNSAALLNFISASTWFVSKFYSYSRQNSDGSSRMLLQHFSLYSFQIFFYFRRLTSFWVFSTNNARRGKMFFNYILYSFWFSL